MQKIHSKLKKLNISPELYSVGWFSSCFLNYDFYYLLKLHILDRFLLFETISVFSFGLVIIKLNKNIFEKTSSDHILRILQDLSLSPYLQNPQKAIKTWRKVWISENKFHQIL
jgi:hypothetical protein